MLLDHKKTLPDVYTDEFMNEDSTVSRQSGNLPGQGLHSTSSSSVAENLPDPLKDFEDVTDLNSGRFGKVMKAKKKLDDMYYAVKRVQVQSKDIKRYAEEVKILAHLLHPNIIRYYHSWLADDYVPISDSSESSISASDQGKKIEKCLFIQMELCEMDLKKWIKQRNATKNVDKNQSLRLFKQIVEAVRYIHSEKLIHRDLKPANIFFTKDVVKIGDFGLVAHMSGEDGACQRTQGTGTPSYMAPEQKEGNKYENEVDIYALGLILFELLWIFTFGTLHEKAIEWAKIRNASLPSDFVRCYPIEECEIKKMLSKEPKKRPSATQLKQFFEAIDILDSRTC
ncbi:interferon-induced, double-stranded RNA-activated protein kinase-like [Gastrophryne carolinensis]